MLGADFRRFLLYLGLAAALWTPILVGTSSLVGHQMFAYFDLIKQYGLWVLLATVLLLWLILKTVVPVFSSRGRRLLLSSWRRKTRWEFWSPTVFYLPVRCLRPVARNQTPLPDALYSRQSGHTRRRIYRGVEIEDFRAAARSR
jgi:hypothetical protein